MNDTLPSELREGAILRGREYAWEISAFPRALQAAPGLGYACLGGQFWFLLPDDSVCEPFWLQANSSDRSPDEEWRSFALRSCEEVRAQFDGLLKCTAFEEEARKFASLQGRYRLLFNAYFVTKAELSKLGDWNELR